MSEFRRLTKEEIISTTHGQCCWWPALEAAYARIEELERKRPSHEFDGDAAPIGWDEP